MNGEIVLVDVKIRSTGDTPETFTVTVPDDTTEKEAMNEIARLKEKYVDEHSETYNATDLVKYIEGGSRYEIQRKQPEVLVI